MADERLVEILKELGDAESKLKAQIEKLFGKVETTDFSDEYAELLYVHGKLQAYINQESQQG